jgi:hypothetical protein
MVSEIKQGLPLAMFVQISIKNDGPCLELRRAITDKELIKFLINCVMKDQPIIVKPQFSNDMQSIAALIEKGILYKGKDNAYYFTF